MKNTRFGLILIILLCNVLIASANSSFTFALFTDLHISPRNQKSTEDLKSAVSDVNKQPNIAFVVVSGDVTETGDLASLKSAKAMLDQLNCPYYIVPGNHETKWSESGATDFARVFGDDKFRLFFNGYLFLGFNSGPVIKMGDGHVAPQDIAWLSNQLKKAGKKQPVFLVTHYPIKDGDVDNWFEVSDAVRPYNIQSFIGGHYHKNLLFSYDGIPGFLGRSTQRAKEEFAGYTMIELADSMYVYEKKVNASPSRWYAAGLEAKVYVEPNNRLFPRPDYSANRNSAIKPVWSVKTGKGIYGSPAVNGDKLFFGDDLGTFNCYSLEKGKLIWKYATRARIASTPAVADGKVVFGSCDKYIYCLNETNGALLWRVAAKNAVLATPIIDNGRVYIGASDGSFRCINLNDGTLIWSFNEVNNYVESRPVIAGDKVIFGAWDSYLYALNKETGKLDWKWNNGNERVHFSPAAVWPVVSHGKVFITAPDRYFTAIDINTGATIWRTNTHVVRETVGLSEDQTTVFSKCMNDSVVAIDATTSNPVVKWKTDAKYGYDHNPCMLVARNGKIMFATKNGEINCLNEATGELIAKYKIGNCIINTMVPVSNTDWVLTTSNGIVSRISIAK